MQPRADHNQIYIQPATATTAESRFSDKPYVCDDCDKAFATSGKLARHRRVHEEHKEYACSFPGCTTRCSRKDNLAQHYRIHFDLRTPEDLAREAPGKRRRKMRVARVAPGAPGDVDGPSTPSPTSYDPTTLTLQHSRASESHGPPEPLPAPSPRRSSPASSSDDGSFSSASASGLRRIPPCREQGFAPSPLTDSRSQGADSSFASGSVSMPPLPSSYTQLQYGRPHPTPTFGALPAQIQPPAGYHMPQYPTQYPGDRYTYPTHSPHLYPSPDVLTHAPPVSRVGPTQSDGTRYVSSYARGDPSDQPWTDNIGN